jgi:hypothetical protein
MARSKDNVYKDTKGKVTFVMFQVEGDDETLQQGFSAMEQAFQRLGAPSRVLAATPASPSLLSRPAAATDQAIDSDGGEAELTVELPEELSESEPGADNHKAKAPRRYTQPKFLTDLKLTSDQLSFKDYVAQKSPQTDNHRYLVASRWLQQYASIDVVTIDHIYTCFQAMKWQSQKDVSQPLRLMAKNDSYYQKNGKGWTLTHVGADAADSIGS